MTPLPRPTARDDRLLSALRTTGSRIRRVRYRENRSVLLSVSRDGRTLNCHACFQGAPPRIIEAIVVYLTARRGSPAGRAALDRLRAWEGTAHGLDAARRRRPPRSRRPTDSPETRPLRTLFDRLNRTRFGGRLPAIPLRISHRMTRSLGTIRYGGVGVDRDGGRRSVAEIAISADLLLSANRDPLEDTMLHEMAHAEAWLRHGHRGHGAPWRRVAERVGCMPRAVCRSPVVRRR